MKLLSNILAPVSCVTVTEGTQDFKLKEKFFDFLTQNRKKKKTAGSEDRER
jgi:hypothetical protein